MRSNIMALQQREADLKKSARNILSVAEKDNRELSREEDENYSKIVKALEANGRELAAETARLAAENSGVAMIDDNMAFAMAARGEIPPQSPYPQQQRPTSGKCRYTDLFGPPAKSAWQNFGEFARAVNYSHQLFDPRLKMAATEDSPSGGGFLVPPDQAATVWDQILETELVRPRATVIPMTSESRKWPAVQDDDHSGGALFSGMSMAGGWSSELEDLNLADLKVRLITLTVNKLGLLQNSSNELLEDTVFEGTLTKKFQEGAGWFLDNAFLFGSGAGQPLGMLSSGNLALVTVPKETTQLSESFLYENAVNMYSSMPPASLKNAAWVFTSSLVPQLLKMQLVVKNVAGTENVGGSACPVLSVAPDGSMTLLTRPVIITEKLSAPGDLGDAAFIDFSQYAIGIRREIRLERSSQAGFKNDSTWFRLTCRVDGQPLWAKAQKLKNGEIVSPFVTLQAR